jgi:hypothetical protein
MGRFERNPIMRIRTIGLRAAIWIVTAMLALIAACSKDTTAPADTSPPAAVNDLVAINPSWNSVMLTWTAPGNHGTVGTAARYDIRYSKQPLTEAVWPSADQAAGEPPPTTAGSADTFVVTGLEPTTTYYFALKTENTEGVWSAKSIIASAPTTAVPDTTPPATVEDLAAVAATTNGVTLTWTAPGDDGVAGTASSYDIRYSNSPITDATWATAFQAGGEPPPKPAGSPESFTVQYLAPGTLYYFALKTVDEKQNWSGLSNVVSRETLTP